MSAASSRSQLDMLDDSMFASGEDLLNQLSLQTNRPDPLLENRPQMLFRKYSEGVV